MCLAYIIDDLDDARCWCPTVGATAGCFLPGYDVVVVGRMKAAEKLCIH